MKQNLHKIIVFSLWFDG